MIIKKGNVKGLDFPQPITLCEELDEETNETYYAVYIDGVFWHEDDNLVHTTVIYELLKEHVTEFYNYKKTN